MRVRPLLPFQFLSTLIRGRELRHFRSPKCPAPGTSGPHFFPEVQNATCQNGSGGLVVPRYFCQTGIGLWPRTSGPLFFSKVQNATCQNGSGGLVVPRYFCQTDIGLWPCTSCALFFRKCKMPLFRLKACGWWYLRHFVRLFFS